MQLKMTEVDQYSGPSITTTISALTDVLRSECRLLKELLVVLQRQREAVTVDDLQGVEESVYATHRVLHTLTEARKRRRSINRMLGESDDLPIGSLDRVLGVRMPSELRQTRDELELLAHALKSDVNRNRRVLREALSPSDDSSDFVPA